MNFILVPFDAQWSTFIVKTQSNYKKIKIWLFLANFEKMAEILSIRRKRDINIVLTPFFPEHTSFIQKIQN